MTQGRIDGDEEAENILRVLAGTVPDVGDTFSYSSLGSTHSYRVAAWLRRRPARIPNLDPLVEEMLRGLEVKYPRRGAGPDNVPLEFCRREQAEYVEGVGVCGVIVRVRDVRVTGRVSWPAGLLDVDRDYANLIAGQPVL